MLFFDHLIFFLLCLVLILKRKKNIVNFQSSDLIKCEDYFVNVCHVFLHTIFGVFCFDRAAFLLESLHLSLASCCIFLSRVRERIWLILFRVLFFNFLIFKIILMFLYFRINSCLLHVWLLHVTDLRQCQIRLSVQWPLEKPTAGFTWEMVSWHSTLHLISVAPLTFIIYNMINPAASTMGTHGEGNMTDRYTMNWAILKIKTRWDTPSINNIHSKVQKFEATPLIFKVGPKSLCFVL